MPRVAVIFHSATGNTATVASAVVNGIRPAGATPVVLELLGSDIAEGRFANAALLGQADGCDALIFGAPTFMGGLSAQFKAFADATSDRWTSQAWRNKLAAGFTTGTSPNGDQAFTLQYFSILAAQHGMLWVSLDKPQGADSLAPNSLGVHLGVAAAVPGSGVHDADLLTARYLGGRVASLARRARAKHHSSTDPRSH